MTLNPGDKVQVLYRGLATITGEPDMKYELHVNGSFRAFLSEEGLEKLRQSVK
jgi:hypothetical protein